MTTNVERQRRVKVKQAAAGRVQVNVWLPRELAADFRQAAAAIRADPDLAIQLYRVSTGRMVKMKPPPDAPRTVRVKVTAHRPRRGRLTRMPVTGRV